MRWGSHCWWRRRSSSSTTDECGRGKARTLAGRLNDGLRRVAVLPALKKPIFFMMRMSPGLARWAAAKAGFDPALVDQLLRGYAPTVWKIDPAPGAREEWLDLLSDEPQSRR